MEYNLAIKKNKIFPFVTTWMDFEANGVLVLTRELTSKIGNSFQTSRPEFSWRAEVLKYVLRHLVSQLDPCKNTMSIMKLLSTKSTHCILHII